MAGQDASPFDVFEQAVGSAAWRRSLGPGETLFCQGDDTKAVFGVERGVMRLVRHAACGRTVVLYRAECGGTFAEAALFSPRYHCDAVAEVASRVVGFPTAVLRDHMRDCADLAMAVAARLARQVQGLRAQVELRNIRSAEERVMAALVLRGEAQGGQVDLRDRLKLFAAEIGLTHEALYRTLRRLENEGRIERRGGLIVLRQAPPFMAAAGSVLQ